MQKPWAKKDQSGWHSLVAHSADVAAVLKVLLTKTVLRSRLGSLCSGDLTPVQIDRLAVLAAFHDAGKANLGFQKGEGGHLRPIIGLLFSSHGPKYLSSLPLEEMTGWFQGEGYLRRYLVTTWSHHGDPIPEASPQVSLWKDGPDGYSPTGALGKLTSQVKEWLPGAFSEGTPLPGDPELENAFAGALTLADWIGSDRRYFPFTNGEDENTWERARENALQAARQIGLIHEGPSAGLSAVLGKHEPYPFQEAGTNIEGQLAIAEGPTGSGKTELALGRYARLRQEGKVEGMYFANPTRTAAKQLYRRVWEAAQDIFEEPPPVVQAVPGYVKAGGKEGIQRGWDVHWESENDKYRNWAAEDSKRYLASPIAVGTIDQVLLSMLQAPHAHMRAAGLLRSLLVVDEVHASSVYMNSILQKMLDVHLSAGGHALLMSATLGAGTRAEFFGQATPSLKEAEDTEYPLVATEMTSEDPSLPSRLEKTVEIEVRRAEDPDLAFRQALETHAGSARVLGIRNTVGGARSVHENLTCDTLTVGERSVSHHSRYAQPDRAQLDEAIEEAYGKDAPPDTVATVATQTVEQSLDIDADLMVTDLCPMDVLLQRIGRLHRHSREELRPSGYETPRCIVLAPARSLRSMITENGEAYGEMGLGTVYEDLRVLQATLDELGKWEEAPITIPRHNRRLVERATHQDILSSIEGRHGRFATHGERIRALKNSQEASVGLNGIDWDTPYSKMRFGAVNANTRLGDMDYVFELDAETPFGNEISEISLPAWMFNDEPDTLQATLLGQGEDRFRFAAANEQFTYTENGYAKDGS